MSYISIIVFVLNILLGIIVLAHNPKERANQIFSLITLSFAIWVFTNFMLDISKGETAILFWSKSSIIGPLILPPLLINFAYFFPKKDPGSIRLLYFANAFLGIFAISSLLMLNTDFNISDFNIIDGIPIFRIGELYLATTCSLFIGVVIAIYFIIRKLPILGREERHQTVLIAIGIFLAIFVGAITQVFLVVIFDFQNLTSLGPTFSIFVSLFTAYSIVKYESFQINIVVSEIFILILLLLISIETPAAIDSEDVAIIAIGIGIIIMVIAISFFLLRNIMVENKREKEIRSLANALADTNSELKRLDRLKDDFIHMAVHDINTPIASILGYLSIILDEQKVEVDDKAREYLEAIYVSGKRLSKVVEEFLDMTKIEGEKLKLNYGETKIADILEEICIEYKPVAKSKNNILTCNLELNKDFTIRIDRDKFKEALINLVDNAIKFTDNGTVEINAKKSDNYFYITIQDSGIGMPSEKIESIFEKFFCVENIAQTQKPEGTGIGLYLSKKIVELHGGNISVESIEGSGTKFTICLPMAKQKGIIIIN